MSYDYSLRKVEPRHVRPRSISSWYLLNNNEPRIPKYEVQQNFPNPLLPQYLGMIVIQKTDENLGPIYDSSYDAHIIINHLGSRPRRATKKDHAIFLRSKKSGKSSMALITPDERFHQSSPHPWTRSCSFQPSHDKIRHIRRLFCCRSHFSNRSLTGDFPLIPQLDHKNRAQCPSFLSGNKTQQYFETLMERSRNSVSTKFGDWLCNQSRKV